MFKGSCPSPCFGNCLKKKKKVEDCLKFSRIVLLYHVRFLCDCKGRRSVRL